MACECDSHLTKPSLGPAVYLPDAQFLFCSPPHTLSLSLSVNILEIVCERFFRIGLLSAVLNLECCER